MTTTAHQDTPSTSEEPYERTSGPVHTWFSLSYCNFLVWHRAHMQSMPLEWQQRFVHLAEELDAAYPDGTGVDYEVNTVRREYVADLTEAEMRQLGISQGDDEDEADEDEPQDLVYYSRDGQELRSFDYARIPVPDPVPHYSRGRTYLPPDEQGIAACREARAADHLAGS